MELKKRFQNNYPATLTFKNNNPATSPRAQYYYRQFSRPAFDNQHSLSDMPHRLAPKNNLPHLFPNSSRAVFTRHTRHDSTPASASSALAVALLFTRKRRGPSRPITAGRSLVSLPRYTGFHHTCRGVISVT